MPAGLQPRELWYDLTPMRPDDFGRQRAGIWNRAERIQMAYRRGYDRLKTTDQAEEQREAHNKAMQAKDAQREAQMRGRG